MPEVRRTRATLRSAELGFLGVWVNTRVHTPRRWGEPFSAGVLDFSGLVSRPLRTSCWIVGTKLLRASNRLRFSVSGHRAEVGVGSVGTPTPGRPTMLADSPSRSPGGRRGPRRIASGGRRRYPRRLLLLRAFDFCFLPGGPSGLPRGVLLSP